MPASPSRWRPPSGRALRPAAALGARILLGTLLGALGLAQAEPPGSTVASPEGSAATERVDPYRLLDQLGRVLVTVENEYVEPADRSLLLQGALQGMVSALDPHSAYLAPQDFAIFQADTEGRFGGIGVEVDFDDGRVTVIAPVEGSPADRAGIRPGDRILAIDGQPVRGKRPEKLVKLMRGEVGTKVSLTVRRDGEDNLLQLTLEREVIFVASVASKLLEGNVGYIRIKSFQQGTHRDLVRQIGELRRKAGGKLEGVVLDLRNNPGGLVHEATAVADEFLSGGIIFSTRHRGRILREARAGYFGAYTRGPLVVLLNEFSASAAELVAGALKDNGRGPIVGTRSFGKGSVQTILDLPDGAGLKLTTALYFTPRGRAIQAQGVEPDVLVEPGYVAARTYQVIRERDLEGHLPGVGEPAVPEPTLQPNGGAPAPEQELRLGVSRDIPSNPTGGKDFALSVGYQIVTGVLSRR